MRAPIKSSRPRTTSRHFQLLPCAEWRCCNRLADLHGSARLLAYENGRLHAAVPSWAQKIHADCPHPDKTTGHFTTHFCNEGGRRPHGTLSAAIIQLLKMRHPTAGSHTAA